MTQTAAKIISKKLYREYLRVTESGPGRGVYTLHVYIYTHAYFDDYKFLRTPFSNSGISVKPNVLPLKASTRGLWVHSSESHRQSNEEALQMPWLLRAMAIYQGLSASAPPQSNSSGS